MTLLSGRRIHITGIVQGVGFRPFVYGLAARYKLNGWVRNTSAGVDIQVDGDKDILEAFIRALEVEIPPLAKVNSFQVDHCPSEGFTNFEIVHSEPIPGAFMPISPDVSICEDCLREMLDPSDRRYLYPFINCTNCGPRFTIIKDIPYDRPKTTMAPFDLCDACRAEYQDPFDRRFHAQPVACSQCGPHLWLEDSSPGMGAARIENDPVASNDFHVIQQAQGLLATGKIIAIKGLGGFHLACDATNPAAVAELRRRKLRVDKPFALMMADIETIRHHCLLTDPEEKLLLSWERPVVLLHRKPGSNIPPSVAPNQDTLGVMLPYTPLHHLLFTQPQLAADVRENMPPTLTALVMTSGNLSEEPIAYTNTAARERLAPLTDAFLLHNRDIHTRCDDSVVRMIENSGLPQTIQLRRSRGYAPNPIKLPWGGSQILAAGAELKNTFCLTKDNFAFLSHHIGDMENYETLGSFEEGIHHFENLFRISVQAIACDLHPDYLGTRYAQERAQADQIPLYQVQHHHAHIAACMLDNGLSGDSPVIGVSFDGTGYGQDGAIWGGEFLIADYRGYHRFAHLEYTPLPGGDAATRKPYRIALAQLWHHGLPWDEDLPPIIAACGDDMSMLRSMLKHRINTPLTSSVGRLFDAAAALSGVRAEVNYEAQAAIEFEALADPVESSLYPFTTSTHSADPDNLDQDPVNLVLGTAPVYHALLTDLRSGVPLPTISAKFHNGLAAAVLDICRAARSQFALNQVALSGGVWQNMTLLAKTIPLLEGDGFKVYTHQQVPPNDGGLVLGQAAVAIQSFATRSIGLVK